MWEPEALWWPLAALTWRLESHPVAQPTGCPHEHRTHLGEETRREVERFFDGLEVATGTVDLFEPIGSATDSVLTIQNAEAVSWCRDCSHVLITWMVGSEPLDMSFPQKEAEDLLKNKFGG